MKLVQILARELVEWPGDGCVAITQDNYNDDKNCYYWKNELIECLSGEWASTCGGSLCDSMWWLEPCPEEIASDHATAIVTRADWEAEREKLERPAEQEGKWIRHRGGKCPVDKGVLVDVRFRNGDILEGVPALESNGSAHPYSWSAGIEFWKKDDVSADIMAYRLHKPAEQVDSSPRKCEGRDCSMPGSSEHSKGCLLDAALDQGWAGPCEWRDRITEIDVEVQARTVERADLVQKLASEGFALIGLAVEPVDPVDGMSDWRNWKTGDLVERIGDDSKYYSIGGHYAVERTSDSAIWLQDDTDEGGHMWFGAGIITENFKWHSRPSS